MRTHKNRQHRKAKFVPLFPPPQVKKVIVQRFGSKTNSAFFPVLLSNHSQAIRSHTVISKIITVSHNTNYVLKMRNVSNSIVPGPIEDTTVPEIPSAGPIDDQRVCCARLNILNIRGLNGDGEVATESE